MECTELLGGGNCTLTKAGETYVTENGVGTPSEVSNGRHLEAILGGTSRFRMAFMSFIIVIITITTIININITIILLLCFMMFYDVLMAV